MGDQKGNRPVKKFVTLISKGSVLEQVKKENRGGQTNSGSSGKQPDLNVGW